MNKSEKISAIVPPMEWAHVDTCLSDYWSGHHLPHVQITVWHGMTMRQIRDAIRSEIRMGAIMGSSDDARLLSADMVGTDEEKRADNLTKRAYAAVNRIRPARKGARRFFTDLGTQGDDEESVYAYFVLVERDK